MARSNIQFKNIFRSRNMAQSYKKVWLATCLRLTTSNIAKSDKWQDDWAEQHDWVDQYEFCQTTWLGQARSSVKFKNTWDILNPI